MLYFLCARCIAFPFSATYELMTEPPNPKLNSDSFEKLRAALVECAEGGEMRAEAELNSSELKHARSGSFQEAVRWYVAHVLDNQSVKSLCARGALSCRELENVFETYLRTHAVQRGLAKEEIAYMASGFRQAGRDRPSTVVQLRLCPRDTPRCRGYAEHGRAGEALGSYDEQEAVVRTELQRRKEVLDNMVYQARGSHLIQEIYRAQSKFLNHLIANLDSRAFAKPTPQAPVESQEPLLIKQDLKLSFKVHLTIHEVKVKTIQTDIKPLFCVFRVQGKHVCTPNRFDQVADLTTNSPLPQIQFDLHMESKGFLRDSKVIATLPLLTGLLCSYKPMETAPQKQLVLDRYSVECLSNEEKDVPQGQDQRCLFQLSTNREIVCLGCRDKSERSSWMQWMTRASGQKSTSKLNLLGESWELDKHATIKDIVSIDVTELDHNKLFAKLFARTLEMQLKHASFNRKFVMDEYCSRYCVRDCTRHIICMQQWLKVEETGVSIWPLMLHSSFCFLQMHVAGKKPNDHSVFVIEEERDALEKLSHQIVELAASKIEGFRPCFPFGQPKDDLKTNIKILSIVSSMHPGLSEKGMVNNAVLVDCLERAALVNYQEVFKLFVSQHPGEVSSEDYVPLSPTLMLDLIQRCIDYMYELHDYYIDEFVECPSVLGDHIQAFWSFLTIDLQESLKICNDVISKVQLFHVLNQYFFSQPTLKLCKFHRNLLDIFGPLVNEYITCLGRSLMDDLTAALDAEDWLPSQYSTGRLPLKMTTDQPDALSEITKIVMSAKTFIVEKVSAPLITFLAQLSLHDPTESFFAKLKLMMPGRLTWLDYKLFLNQTLPVFLENLIQDNFQSILVAIHASFEESASLTEVQLNSGAFNATQDRVRMEKSRLQLLSCS
eukprot:Em0003g1487a